MSEMRAVIMEGTGQLMSTAVMWGIYALLFSTSVFLLVQKGVAKSTPRQILLFATCLMFTATCALAAVDAAIYLVQFSDGDYLPESNKLQLACEVLFDSLFLMGDAIVIWRTWTLCPDRKLLVMFPIVLWFSGIVCVITMLALALHTGAASAWSIGVYDGLPTLHLSMATAGLSAATNFFSTLLISWKAWQRRALFRTQARAASRSSQGPAKIMSLLIESGFIYFGLWVIAMLNFYIDWHAPVLQAVLRGGYDMVIGLYPTLIIVLVHLPSYTVWTNSDSAPTTTTSRTMHSTGVFSTMPPSVSVGSVMVLSPAGGEQEKKAGREW
ncbi:hypothetical protein C8R46DRAFT_1188321 [Mycena filopes]|nr:hypothetical protein C8R46DRAFT_1188321 [Mycena filopes]